MQTVSQKLERALALHQSGNVAEAAPLYREILAEDGRHFDALHLLGLVSGQFGRHEEAERLIASALEVDPNSTHARVNHAISLMSLGRLDDALATLDRALEAQPDHPDALYHRGNLSLATGRPQAALRHYDRLLRVLPEQPEILTRRGNALAALGRMAEGLVSFEAAIRLQPEQPEPRHNRGLALVALGRVAEALADLKTALVLAPAFADAWATRGRAMLAMSRSAEALPSARRTLTLAPASIDGLTVAGIALTRLRRPDEALVEFRRALALAPDNVDLLTNSGAARAAIDDPVAAIRDYDRVLAIRPGHVDAHYNRANTLLKRQRAEEAIAGYETVIRLDPTYIAAHSNKIFALDFVSDVGDAQQYDERRRWYEMHGRRHRIDLPHPNPRDPERRLVVGYVSADLRNHSAAVVFGPALRRLDRAKFEVVLYSNSRIEDAITRDFRLRADRWRLVEGMTDDEVASQVRADGVDILVDLSGHSEGNRLLVFARKPAPVQVTAWGHVTGTGLPEIDYVFGDPVSIPPSARAYFAETPFDLPCFVGFEPPADAPDIGPSPALATGEVTFGFFNRLNKITPTSLDLWARIMMALPTSRLLMKDRHLDDPTQRDRMAAAFHARGVDRSRIDFLGSSLRREHMAAIQRADIVLDPVHNSGGTSTWEALWMGVPMVAWPRTSVSSRNAAAILSSIGLQDWIAMSADAYVDTLVTKARDIPALAALRGRLRETISNSEAGDPDRYARAVENAYRTIWRRWCAASR